MTLWCALNGYLGNSEVGALVEADTEEEARDIAIAALRAEEEAYPTFGTSEGPRASYWEIESIFPVRLPYVGDRLPYDGYEPYQIDPTREGTDD